MRQKGLHLKRVLAMRDGQIEALEKSRRKSAALESMLEIVVERIGNQCRVHVATAHANSDADTVALLAAASGRLGPVEAFVRPRSPVMALLPLPT